MSSHFSASSSPWRKPVRVAARYNARSTPPRVSSGTAAISLSSSGGCRNRTRWWGERFFFGRSTSATGLLCAQPRLIAKANTPWRKSRACGCLHEAALLAFPELALLIDLHLADPETGEPMNAEANALYFYRTARGLPGGWSDEYHHAEREGLSVADYARRLACSILRVDVIPLDDVPEQDLAAAFPQFVNDQRERWQREAKAGRARLEAIPTIYELRGYDVAGKPIERRSYPNCAAL
jgi:hypothetical protein